MTRDINKRLADQTVIALRCAGDEWGGSFFRQTLIPDTWMGLVVAADGRRRFVPAGEDPQPQHADTLVLVRNRAITVPLDLNDASSSDDHAVEGCAELLLRCPQRDDELAALRQTLLVEQELTLNGLSSAVEQAGALTALRAFVQARSARDLVQTDQRTDLLDALRVALRPFLFSAGLELERIGRVEFASRTLTEQQALDRRTARQVRELEARDLVERTALAATHRRLDDLNDVLAKLRHAAADEGTMQWHELLPTLTPGERGRLLENLWRLTPDRDRAEAIVAVAGRECVWIDPRSPDEILRRVALPDELGGLRSVACPTGSRMLLVGAARGVWRLRASDGEIIDRFVAPGAEQPQTGFNAAVTSRGFLFATHSQLGAWSWSLNEPEDAQPLLKPIEGVPRTIRAVTVDARGRVLLAADEHVHAFDLAGETAWQTAAADGRVHCLAPLEEWLYAGTSRGTLLRCDLDLRDGWTPIHRAGSPIESVSARRWDDLIELIIPAGPDGVHGVYAGEGIVSRLLTANTPIRRTWACDDTIIGLTDARDRLIVLNGDNPRRDGVPVPVARWLGWSIQDACLVVQPAHHATHATTEEHA